MVPIAVTVTRMSWRRAACTDTGCTPVPPANRRAPGADPLAPLPAAAGGCAPAASAPRIFHHQMPQPPTSSTPATSQAFTPPACARRPSVAWPEDGWARVTLLDSSILKAGSLVRVCTDKAPIVTAWLAGCMQRVIPANRNFAHAWRRNAGRGVPGPYGRAAVLTGCCASHGPVARLRDIGCELRPGQTCALAPRPSDAQGR